MKVQLREICGSRAGDKGNISNVGIFCYDPNHYDIVKSEITAEKVKEYFGSIVKGKVDRFEIPGLKAFQFVCHEALDGGTTRSLRLDAYGKAQSGYILSMELEVPDELIKR